MISDSLNCVFLFTSVVSKRCCTIYLVSGYTLCSESKKVQVGKDQEKAQSEKDSHSKNRGGKKPK